VRIADDMFARFVTVLSRHLDDDELRTGSLAAELFVSRSLLDRLVAGVTGETTARFRRRILLERAAFGLRSTDVSVLDAANGAGYSSGEAFARAFLRAYGTTPSRWRTSAASFQITSPNGVHFYPPGGLRLPARQQETPMQLTADMIDQHVELLGQMLDRAGDLSDDELDAPLALPACIDRDPTIRSLLSRLVGQLGMWNAAMASQPYDFTIERQATIDSMRDRLNRAGPAFAAYVRDTSEHNRFDETFVDATSAEPYVFTAAGMIAHIITYGAYRRTVLTCALEAVGVSDLCDDPLTWFAP
jgi:AraC family transcriptional regulator